MSTPRQPSGWAVRVVTVAAVLLVATVAALVSYAHMREVAGRAGEGWRAWLLPLSVDGLVVAASMVLLTRRRVGLPGGWLAWCALLGGVGASLAANIAAAEPTTTARMVASWPAVAFAVAFELLLQQRRVAVAGPVGGDPPAGDSVGDVGEPAPPSRVARETPVPAPPVEVPPVPVEPADRVAVLGDRPADPGDRVPVGDPVGDYAGGAGHRPADPVAELDDLAARTRALLAASPGRPPGRRALARELGVSEHQARTLLDLVSPNGTSPTDGGGPR